MGQADAGHLMGNLLIHSQDRAHHAFIRAANANAPEQENIHLRYLGRSLVSTGQVNTAAAYQAFINYVPPARNQAYPLPTYMHVIPRVIQAFTFFCGITAMVIGWLLIVNNNPRQHRRLAKVILLPIMFASAFALGMLLFAA